MKTTYIKGIEAEELAANHLQKQGMRTLQKRFKSKYGEIDLIAVQALTDHTYVSNPFQQNHTIVFCEVKYRKFLDTYCLTDKQLKRLYNTATIWLGENREYQSYECRFDAIFIDLNKQILHLPNITVPSMWV